MYCPSLALQVILKPTDSWVLSLNTILSSKTSRKKASSKWHSCLMHPPLYLIKSRNSASASSETNLSFLQSHCPYPGVGPHHPCLDHRSEGFLDLNFFLFQSTLGTNADHSLSASYAVTHQVQTPVNNQALLY